MNAASVCWKFETLRREDITFKNHAEVAAFLLDEADALLDWWRKRQSRIRRGNCPSISVFVEHMRWVTRIAAPILLADVGDHRFRTFGLDLKSCNERVFGVHGDVVRLPVQFKSNGKLHLSASFCQEFEADVHLIQAISSSPRPGGLNDLLRAPADLNAFLASLLVTATIVLR